MPALSKPMMMMMMMSTAAASLALGLAGPVSAREADRTSSDPVAWSGTLAGRQILLSFDPAAAPEGSAANDERDPEHGYGKSIVARYFYRAKGLTLALVRQPDGRILECQERFDSVDCDKPTGLWRLPARPGKGQSGFEAGWRAAAGKPEQRIVFTRAAPGTWEDWLTKGPTRVTGVFNQGSFRAGFLTDVRSDAKVPQLLSGWPAEVMVRFNALQAQELPTLVSSRLDNLSLDGGEEDDSKVQFLSRKLIATGGYGGGFYGGAHPTGGYSATVTSVTDGKPVDVRRRFFRHMSDQAIARREHSGLVTIPMAELTRERTIEGLILQKLFSPELRTLRGETDPECLDSWKESLGGEDAAGLNYARTEGRYSPSLELLPTVRGLGIVSNDTPEVTRGCRGIMFILPWATVKPYLVEPLQ